MSRRRPPRDPTAMTDQQTRYVANQINKLEKAYLAQTIERPFTPMNVVEWLIPADIIAKLQAANGLTAYISALEDYSDVRIPNLAVAPAHFNIRYTNLNMLPAGDHIMLRDLPDGNIAETLRSMFAVHREFQVVRDVIEFLNQKGTAGAFRAYWPSIMALVPSDSSPLHEAQGTRYKDIPGIGAWVARLRETSDIIARALLLPPKEIEEKATVSIYFQYPVEGGNVITSTFDLV